MPGTFLAKLAGSSVTPDFHGRVAVITGASAGVGRATALGFARAGASVGLVARDAAALEETKAEIESGGGTAEIFAGDVAEESVLKRAAEAFETSLGPIDIWVNNAMVTVYSPIARLTAEEARRVTDVTYLGYVYGTMAALKHMRGRNSGTIVQVGSALAYRGIPLQSVYCAAKHAVRAFTEALRCELIEDKSRIRVTEVHLPAINTPQFDWARTRDGRKPRPVPPVFEPEEAAAAILRAAGHPGTREYWLDRSTAKVILGNMLAPSFLDRLLAKKAFDAQWTKEEGHPHIRDNLFEPESGLHRARGSFGHEAKAGPLVLSGDATRTAGILLACGLSAGIGYALAGLLERGTSARRRQ